MNLDTQLGYAYALKNEHTKARLYLEKLINADDGSKSLNYDYATLYTGLGEHEKAIEYLNKCVEERNGQCIMMGLSPIWKPLRPSGDFQYLLEQIGIKN